MLFTVYYRNTSYSRMLFYLRLWVASFTVGRYSGLADRLISILRKYKSLIVMLVIFLIYSSVHVLIGRSYCWKEISQVYFDSPWRILKAVECSHFSERRSSCTTVNTICKIYFSIVNSNYTRLHKSTRNIQILNRSNLFGKPRIAAWVHTVF
jgi:hypothetical protein